MKFFANQVTRLRSAERLLRWTAVCYALVVCAVAVYLHWFGDVTPVGMLLLFAPRWLFVLPWCALALTFCAVRARLAASCAVAALLTAMVVADFEVPQRRGAVSGRAIRVVTYNTDRSPLMASRVRRDLAYWNADVVVFQDCADSLADSLRQIRAESTHRISEFCIISKLPVETVDTMAAVASEPRTRAIRMQVATPRGPIAIVGVHFDSPRDALWSARQLDFNQLATSIERRTINSRRVAQWVAPLTVPVLVVGDFNLPTSSNILERDWRELEDAFAARGWGFGHTMFAGKFAVRIDHVLMSAKLRTDRVVVYRHYPSDHQPLLADIAWAQ